MAGDIFLMLPKERFVAGLVSFLIAHLCYRRALYIAVISLMVWRVLVPLAQPEGLSFGPLLVTAGALLFHASDAALAWDKFVRPLPARRVLVMSTCFAAQYCFAASVAWPAAA